VASALFFVWLLPPPPGLALGLGIALLEAVLGAAIATLLEGRFGAAALSKKIVTFALLGLAAAGNIGIALFLMNDGTMEGVVRLSQQTPAPPPLTIADPSKPGPFAVKTLFYGSGNDKRRPEFAGRVSIKTPTLDATPFFRNWDGMTRKIRRAFWGFDIEKFPLNGRVWYPDGSGPFPLALIVHGNHAMEEFSDPGYAYLGELLASRGFILVSVDENFLNGSWAGEAPKEQAARGWFLLEHLKLWRAWNADRANPFFGKVDLADVAVMGHSRGGEAAATAAAFNRLSRDPDDATLTFDYGFNIKAVVAIAPADGQYKPSGRPRAVENVNYFVLQGGNDGDVSSFAGSRQYERVRFTGGQPWFKSELWIYGANHNQFNTVWGNSDFPGFMARLSNRKPIIPGDEQRQIAKTYIPAFLEATLHGKRDYIALFQDYRRGSAWLPALLYVTRFEDSDYKVVASFEEDIDVTTATLPGARLSGQNLTVWREQRIPLRDGSNRETNGVFLGWNRSVAKGPLPPVPVYTVALPPGQAQKWGLGLNSNLELALASVDEDAPLPDNKKDEKKNEKKDRAAPDFQVELQDTDGKIARLPLSRFAIVPPPLKVRFTKIPFLDEMFFKKASEPVIQRVSLPLAAFVAAASGFDPAKLSAIRFRFDKTPTAVVVVREIGFSESR
jgi:dienelactone hydrolase